MATPGYIQLLSNLNTRLRDSRLDAAHRVRLNRLLIVNRSAFDTSLENTGREGASRTGGVEPALRFITDLAQGGSPLSLEALVEVQRLLLSRPEAPGYRESTASAMLASHEPLPPATIGTALRRLFDWIQSPAFQELHPTSQMAVAQARLLEIMPFQDATLSLISIFSAVLPMSRGLLLPVPRPGVEAEWLTALELALQFSTDALTEWNLNACIHAYDLAETLI